jgi:hypothetical protein
LEEFCTNGVSRSQKVFWKNDPYYLEFSATFLLLRIHLRQKIVLFHQKPHNELQSLFPEGVEDSHAVIPQKE